MAFLASGVIPAEQYQRAKRVAVQVKLLADTRAASFATGATSAEILSTVDNLRALKSALDEAKATPGIADYARSQEDNQAYDVVAEFNAMLAAIDAVIANVVTTIPKDGSGFLLVDRIETDGSLTPRDFTGPQLTGLVNELNSLSAAIG